MKLDIGSGQSEDDSYLRLDDLSDAKWLRESVDVVGDGNNLPFKDETFDEVFSCRCIGHYARVDEAIRVLKVGGKLRLFVWNEKELLGEILHKLISSGLTVSYMEATNVDYDTEPEEWDVIIEATKEEA